MFENLVEDKVLADRGIDVQSDGRIPIDSSLYVTSEYLKAIEGYSSYRYNMYLLFLRYYTGQYKLKGHPDIERLSYDILRQAIEFGKVAVVKVKERLIPYAVVDIQHNIYHEIMNVEITTLRSGIAYNRNVTSGSVKSKHVAVLKNNYQGFPFMFFWDKPIRTIMQLEDAAVTGSIASIKKFKRNLNNNDSAISRLETKSMTDPTTPYINVMTTPMSYKEELRNKKYGNTIGSEKEMAINANAVEMTNVSNDTLTQWENIKEYMNYVFMLYGRRTNTAKKRERNLEGEINMETLNFDILEAEFEGFLEKFCKECKDKFGYDITFERLKDTVEVQKGTTNVTGEKRPEKGEM